MIVNSILVDKEGSLPIQIGCKNCGTRDSFTNIRNQNNKSVDECLQQESISNHSVSEHSHRTPTPTRVNFNTDGFLITDRTGSISRQEVQETSEIFNPTQKTSVRQSKFTLK